MYYNFNASPIKSISKFQIESWKAYGDWFTRFTISRKSDEINLNWKVTINSVTSLNVTQKEEQFIVKGFSRSPNSLFRMQNSKIKFSRTSIKVLVSQTQTITTTLKGKSTAMRKDKMHHHTISMQRLEELSTYLVFVTVNVSNRNHNCICKNPLFLTNFEKLPRYFECMKRVYESNPSKYNVWKYFYYHSIFPIYCIMLNTVQ